jgi:hypothetical protein
LGIEKEKHGNRDRDREREGEDAEGPKIMDQIRKMILSRRTDWKISI